MRFGEKLYYLRKKNGISQEQLAFKLNVSRQAISKWEMGSIPDVSNIIKIAEFFDCSLDYLLNDQLGCNEENINKRRKEDFSKDKHEAMEDKDKKMIKINSKIIFLTVAFADFFAIVMLFVISEIFHAPLYRKDIETGNWFVGIHAFIDYHNLYGIVCVLFIILLMTVFVMMGYSLRAIWPDRLIESRRKQMVCLCSLAVTMVLGIVALFYRMLFVNIFVWNVWVVIVFFIYVILLSANVLLYLYYKNRAEKGG